MSEAARSAPAISVDMLPAIRAVVVRRKVWAAVGILLLWGVINIGLGVQQYSDVDRLPTEAGTAAAMARLVACAGIVAGGVLAAFAVFGAVTRHPRTIMLTGVSLIVAGVWNAAFPLIVQAALRVRVQGEAGWAVFGLLQVLTGLREARKYRRIASWLPEMRAVGREGRAAAAAALRRFVRLDEDYFTCLLRVGAADRSFLSASPHPVLCRGQLFDEQAVLVSRNRAECLTISRDAAAAGVYKKDGKARIRTDAGRRQLSFGPLSALSFKAWAGVAVTPADLHRAVRTGNGTLGLLGAFLAAGDPALRIEALGNLPRVSRD